MKKNILVFLISFSSIPMIQAADYFSYPLVRVSYDFNLGYTTSIGGGIIFTNGGEFEFSSSDGKLLDPFYGSAVSPTSERQQLIYNFKFHYR